MDDPSIPTYTINYMDVGDREYTGSNLSSLTSSYKEGATVTLIDGVKEGYIFKGWYDNSEGTGTPVTSISSTNYGNKIFYANWEYDTSIYDYVIPEASEEVIITNDRITEENYMKITDFLNLSQGGVNLTRYPINRIDVTITYSSPTGSKQSISVNVTTSNGTLTQRAQFNGKATNEQITVSFTNLNILLEDEFFVTAVKCTPPTDTPSEGDSTNTSTESSNDESK